MKFLLRCLLIFIASIALASALKEARCGLPKSQCCTEDGKSCLMIIPSWSYDKDQNKCEAFNFSGCGGNDNRFESEEECLQTCQEL